jgi:hypothetical protein
VEFIRIGPYGRAVGKDLSVSESLHPTARGVVD